MTGRATQIRRLAADWPASLLGGWRHRHDFRELESYCFFIGHPRSGHSIVGDKQGEGAVLRLRQRPSLLRRLRKTVRLPLRCIHVVRHPLDNITTICRKADLHGIDPGLDAAIDYYFALCETITAVRAELAADEVFELRHEAFVEHPRQCLDRLCRFIGVTADPDYLDACASVVRPTPRRSRETIDWPRESTERVLRRSRAFPFLNAYTDREVGDPG